MSIATQDMEPIMQMIELDGPEQGIDFADPANAFTVWTEFTGRMTYCGSRKTLDDAWMLAADHVNLTKGLYIVNAEISPFGILKFERN